MTVVFYISGHGFGHAIRQTAIVNVLADARPDLRLVIRTSVAPWLFARNLQSSETGRAAAEVQSAVVDIGAVQRGSLEVDVAGTVAAVSAFHRDIEARADEEARALEALDTRLVVSDIPVVAFLAAARRGIPAIGISNFTWDWIYEDYAAEFPEACALAERIGTGYGLAAEGWRLPMSGGFATFPVIRDLPLVARIARLGRAETRARLGLPAETPLVLVSLGGFGAAGLNIATAAGSLHGLAEIVVTSYDACAPAPGLRCVDEASMYGSGVQYQDLLAAVDVVASKPGYGIISDCAANDTALLYTSRGRFREYDVLVSALPALVRSRFIDQGDLVDGHWRAAVDQLLTAPSLPVPPRADGASLAASWLSAFLPLPGDCHRASRLPPPPGDCHCRGPRSWHKSWFSCLRGRQEAGMGRAIRAIRNDSIYHVFNRGAGKRQLFDTTADYDSFAQLLREVQTRVSMRLLAYCLMPNHWHFVVWPFEANSLATFMQRLTTKHAVRHNRDHGLPGCGHVYQGRFQSVAVNGERQLITILRYVEANPRKSGLVARAEDWPWSSASAVPTMRPRPTVDTSPVPRPSTWLDLLNHD